MEIKIGSTIKVVFTLCCVHFKEFFYVKIITLHFTVDFRSGLNIIYSLNYDF